MSLSADGVGPGVGPGVVAAAASHSNAITKAGLGPGVVAAAASCSNAIATKAGLTASIVST